MSRIDALAIQGVRSFGIGHKESIKFNTPLTLIVGYNGSGKTTIIECLKYATTGELPPNSKGGNFVHDPKLCDEKEVRAQVKLRFFATSGKELTLTRSLQVTLKKNTRSQKTLEGSLRWVHNGEQGVASSKTSELDEEIPKHLGVSAAILDSVIFCHQDESLWPLSEPSVLKKKFDEIFEAGRYTKAVDSLKVLRKKHGEALRILKEKSISAKSNKVKAENIEKKSRDLQADIEKLREKSDEATKELKEIQDATTRTREEANHFLGIVQELKNKNEQYQFRQDAARELRNTIEEMSESDEWLENTLAQYEQRLESMENEIEDNRSRHLELQKELASSRKTQTVKLAEKGKLQSDKEKYERQLQTRIDMIRAAAARHEIRGYDGDLEDKHVHAFDERIQKLLTEKKRELDRLQKNNQQEVSEVSDTISELESRRSSRMQDRISARQRIASNNNRSDRLGTEINALNFDEGAIAVLQSTQNDLDQRYQKAQEDLVTAGWDRKIQEEEDRLRQLENEGEKLSRELVECTRLATERAQLDLRKKELVERKRKLDTLTNTWKAKLDAIIGSEWQAETVESDFQVVLKQQNTKVAEARQRVEAKQQELKQLEYKLSTARDKRKTLSSDSTRCQNAVLAILKQGKEDPDSVVIEDYTEELDELEDEKISLEKDLALYDKLKEYYTKSRTYLDKYNKCSLCERGFDDHDQLRSRSRLIKKIADNISDEEKVKLEELMSSVDKNLNQMRGVRPQYDAYRRAKSELPAVEKEIEAAETQKGTVVRQLEDEDVAHREADEKRQDIESMSKAVLNISQTHREISESEKQIDRLASQQSSTGAMRSADEVNELQATCADQTRTVKQKLGKLSVDRQRMKDLLNSLELERSELKNKLSSAQRQLERKTNLLDQIQMLRDENAQQQMIVEQTDEDIGALEPEISKARELKEATLQRVRAKEQKVAEERDKISHTVSELKMIDNDIQDYIDRGGASELTSIERSIKVLDETMGRYDKEMADLMAVIDKQKQELANGDRQKKNINNNLNYRKNLRLLERLALEINDLKSRNANDDYDRLHQEVTGLESQYNRLFAQRSGWMSEMNAKDSELGRLIDEWELEYKNAEVLYKETLIKVEGEKGAIEDLKVYGEALDKAIMQYHSLKMEEVNRTAGELWQATYQGTDIDTILIRSENETATGKRSYNYRLCMVKQDTEMDMRGRCSAGQKVLASIIIRLALAESFGVNCGLIALDEPTTNLDSDNIRSLAISLHGIIKARQAQSNFQLIIITHDEEFLRHMQCSDFCDTFWRVKRDDRQESVIVKESITRVSE